ncbi:MAG: hypothetical protein ABIW03_04350 [Sphingomicrobium sp.]
MDSSSNRAGLFLGLFVLNGMLLSGCGKQSQAAGNDLVLQPSRDIGLSGAKFGKAFEKAYLASPNSEPKSVHKGDVLPLSLTAEPIMID